jgi:hypothetical protein
MSDLDLSAPAVVVTQTAFSHAMMDGSAAVPAGLIDSQNASAGRRFAVYRNNIAVSLTEAMHSAFPVIAKLLGKANMDGLAGLYLRAHPPSSPLMMFYGAEFPAFLEAMPQLSHLGYLGDVARLELALRHSYHAADAAPIAPEALADLSEADLLATKVTFAPALQLLRSQWPLYAIWHFNTVAGAPKPQAGAQNILITRPEFDPMPQVLSDAAILWVSALKEGASIAEAVARATEVEAGFDLVAPLTLLLQGNAIIGLEHKG